MIDNFVVAFYFFIVVVIGIIAARGVTSIKDYATSGTGFGMFVLMATLTASYIGGGTSFGNAEKVFLFGISNILVLWAFGARNVLLACFVVPKMARFRGAISVGDIIAVQYGRLGQVITGISGVLLCCGIVGGQIAAIGYFFQHFFGLDRVVGILLGCGLTILYTTFGGMRSVIFTDVFQFFILAIGLPITCILALAAFGGPAALIASIPVDHLGLPGSNQTWMVLIGLILSLAIGETLAPPYAQRLLAGKTGKQTTLAAFWAALFTFPFAAISGIIGLAALAMAPDLNPNLAMPFVIDAVMPPVLKGFLIAAIMAIIMSSADSFLNSASISFTHDVYKPLRRAPFSGKAELLMARAVTFVIGFGAIGFSLNIESVLDILIFAYQFWGPVVMVPLIAAILGCERGPKTFLASALVGAGSAFFWTGGLGDPFDMPGLVVGVLANALVFWLYRTPARLMPAAEAA